jgi:3-oxoacyl-[acyl-carrier protein] reductase
MRKCAIVTGAASGMGYETVKRLARDGFDIVADYHTEKPSLDALCAYGKRVGAEILPVKADVSDPKQCIALAEKTMERFGRADVLVNNAGTTSLDYMLRMSDSEFERVMHVNAYGTFYTMREFGKIMKKQRSGSIINITSVGGMYGSPWSIGYAASKGAVISMTKTAAKELAISGIRVNAVAPGGCDTGMVAVSQQQIKDQLKYVTMRRLAKPQEIASAVAFLASEDASYITGHILEVSGGVMM